MEELDTAQLRAFLAGDDTFRGDGGIWGYLDETVLIDPSRLQRRTELVDGKFVVRSPLRGTVGEIAAREVSSVACLGFRKRPGTTLLITWLVGRDGVPLAEVPWGKTAEQQAVDAGLAVRFTKGNVDKKAYEALRPEQRLV